MQARHACMLSSYPASIVCLRAKHACRPKYAFGERIHAGTTCLHSCARRAGVGWGLNRKLELRPKRHELIFGGIPSSLVIHPKRKPFSHAFGFGFGKTAVSASELCSVVLIRITAPWPHSPKNPVTGDRPPDPEKSSRHRTADRRTRRSPTARHLLRPGAGCSLGGYHNEKMQKKKN